MTSKMKTTLSLLSIALIAPATIAVGVSAPIAFGITAVLGVSSILLSDYGTVHHDYRTAPVVAKVAAKPAERNALAA